MAQYQQLLVSDILTRLGRRTDGADANVFWVQQEKLDAFNEAVRIWQCLVGQFEARFSQSVPPNNTSNFLPVPRQFSSLTRVAFNGSQLTLLSLSELDNGYPGWFNTSGTPLYWAPVGINNVALYPYPTGGELQYFGYTDLQRLRPTDYITIGWEELTRILEYAGHYLSFKEGMTELQSSSVALQRLAEAAAFKNGRIQATEFYNHYMGLNREMTERPVSETQTVGIR